LEPDQHDHRGWGFRQVNLSSFATKDFFQLALHDLDDLLAGVQCLGHFFPESALFDVFDELTNRGNGNVGVQKSTANLARCRIDIRLSEPAFTPQVLKGRGQTFRQSIEHAIKSLLSTQPESEVPSIENGTWPLTLSSPSPGTHLLHGIYLAANAS